MRRINLFLTLTIISLASLVAVVIAGYYVLSASSTSQNPSNWMGQIWGGMSGMMSGTQTQTQNVAAPYFGIAFVIFAAVTVLGIGGIAYFALFPQIKVSKPSTQSALFPNGKNAQSLQILQKLSENAVSPYESVHKTLTVEERKVVEVLTAHGGKYLQKYIRNEAEMSRLQTHRIVARLAERGIVSLEKTGNTNTVFLADWLKQPSR
jgi:uncharacterized membrane protein